MGQFAFITGIFGQDSRFLTKHLLDKNYTVYGMMRRSSKLSAMQDFIKDFGDKVKLRYGDMTDPSSIRKILAEAEPDEVYNLAAQSDVRVSFDIPEYTAEVNATGVVDLISAMREIVPQAKLYQASTSECFGRSKPPQNETSIFQPTSPYGTAKLHAYWEVRNAREGYNMFACNGLLFNHESEYRGENFVTRKITSSIARIVKGKQQCLSLGNLDAKRDWGSAQDFVKAMWMMLQHDKPDDYVVATGIAHTVREFLEMVLQCSGISYWHECSSDPLEEKYYNSKTGKVIVKIDPSFYRPVEVDYLLGDSTKIRNTLGWEPEVTLEQLVSIMYKHDFEVQ